MTAKTRVGLGVLAILAILLSFGLDWFRLGMGATATFTMNGVDMGFPAGSGLSGFPLGGGGFEMTVDAGNGQMTVLGLALDIWVLAVVALLGAALATVSAAGVTQIPRFVPLVVLGLAALYLGSGLQLATADGATLLPGFFAALAGVVCALVVSVVPARAPAS